MLKPNLGQTDRRLVRDDPSSGEQEVLAELLPAQLPVCVDRCPGGLRRLKSLDFAEVGNFVRYMNLVRSWWLFVRLRRVRVLPVDWPNIKGIVTPSVSSVGIH